MMTKLPGCLILSVVVHFCLVSCSVALGGGRRSTDTTLYPADDAAFAYSGRWRISSANKWRDGGGVVARADWPCSRFQFRVSRTPIKNENDGDIVEPSPAVLSLRLNLLRVRVRVVVTNDANGNVESSTIIDGNSFLDSVKTYNVALPSSSGDDTATYTVSLTKLTQASPYSNGLGKSLRSVLEFHGADLAHDGDVDVVHLLERSSWAISSRRRIALVGASDTAGYCVDGTPETSDAQSLPWKYDNCDMASHAVYSRRLNAETSVQAMAGIGLTQNAFADKPFLLGKPTMPDYYGRTLQTEKTNWDFSTWRPDIVLISLGGNDFNHQEKVPSNETFSAAYQEFLEKIAAPWRQEENINHDGDDTATNTAEKRRTRTTPTIVSICGQGDPTEVERDPNNDRCRPCPHVQEATEAFQKSPENSGIRVEYIFIPCDGSVVTGVDDIGCEGHKNRLGQKRVADFLEPKLRAIMDWKDDEDTKRTPVVEFPLDPSLEMAAASSSARPLHPWRDNIVLLLGVSVVGAVVLAAHRILRALVRAVMASRGQPPAQQNDRSVYKRCSSSSVTAATVVDDDDDGYGSV